jgi:hypothetical protein
MDKLELTGQALGRVYNFRSGCMCTLHLLPGVAIQPNLELKTQPKPVLGSLPLAFALPGLYHPLYGVTIPKYKLLHFLTTKIKFCKEKKILAFNWLGGAI